MSDKIDKIKIRAQEIILFTADALALGLKVFDYHGLYRKTIDDFYNWRDLDRNDFSRKLYYLKQNKLIKIYQKGKNKYLELTPKGLRNAEELLIKNRNWEQAKWDNKWRIIVFDIPTDKNDRRDAFRRYLERWGFIQFQKSVFIFPFECRSEVEFISQRLFIAKYIKYIVADFFQDDYLLIKEFIKKGILPSEKNR